jgi:hypothetical protein
MDLGSVSHFASNCWPPEPSSPSLYAIVSVGSGNPPRARGPIMTTKPRTENTSDSSPGQSGRREQLLRIYDELDDAGKQELLRLAQELLRPR